MGEILISASIFGQNVQGYFDGDSDFPQFNDNWSPEDKKNALAYLKTLESFFFFFVW